MSDKSFQKTKFNSIKKALKAENEKVILSSILTSRTFRLFSNINILTIVSIGSQALTLGIVLAIDYFFPGLYQPWFWFSEDKVINGLIWVLIAGLIITIWFRSPWRPFQYQRLEFSRMICLNLSVCAAQEIESDEVVKGSFLTKKLFEKIEGFSEIERLNIGQYKSSLKNSFQGYIEKLHKNRDAVAQAVLECDIPSIFLPTICTI